MGGGNSKSTEKEKEKGKTIKKPSTLKPVHKGQPQVQQSNRAPNMNNNIAASIAPNPPDPNNLFERLPSRDERKALDLDSLIQRLLNVVNRRLTISIAEEELCALTIAAKEVFKNQPMLLELEPNGFPLVVLGDIHGQYSDLLRIFAHHGFPPKANYLLLGDYVDRGSQSIETICLLFCYKIKYPESFFLLRGNHESNPIINVVYGFYIECKSRYMTDRLFNYFQETFKYMPVTALIGGKILCMHGGISPHLDTLDQLRQIPRPNVLFYANHLRAPTDAEAFALDLIWSDPSNLVNGWQKNPRGASWVFGEDVLNETRKKLGIDMVLRAHQVVPNGFESMFGGRCVTLFSAPYYMGSYDNAAGSLVVDDNLRCHLVVFRK